MEFLCLINDGMPFNYRQSSIANEREVFVKTSQLGQLERVDLRNIWLTEAKDFTPWLAKEENLKLLGDAIGIDLAFEAQEKGVGPYRADILAKDIGDGSWVLIENQLEGTDHNHLGQILTYAAGLNAVTIVWISKQFTEEHRATLDWLNEVTSESVGFFGLEVELWKIGDSSIAPKFNVVVKPNDWTKGGGSGGRLRSAGELTPTKLLQLEYWTEFRKHVLGQQTVIRPQKPSPQHWMNAAIGTSRAFMYAFVDTRDHRIGVRLVLTGPDHLAHFHLLEDEKKAIEKEFGQKLVWDELPEKKTSYISLYKAKTNPKEKTGWKTQHIYLLNTLEQFHKVFSERVQDLDAGEYQPETTA